MEKEIIETKQLQLEDNQIHPYILSKEEYYHELSGNLRRNRSCGRFDVFHDFHEAE